MLGNALLVFLTLVPMDDVHELVDIKFSLGCTIEDFVSIAAL